MNTLILNAKQYRYEIYENKNTDEYVIFLLGALQDIESVRNLSIGFSQNINCLTVEIPGTGKTESLDASISIKQQTSMLLDFINHMKIERFHLIAFSYATAIAFELCHICPYVASISTCGGVPGIPKSGKDATKKMIAASIGNKETFAKVFADSLISKIPEIPRSAAIYRATEKAVSKLDSSQINTFFENSVRLLVHNPQYLKEIKIPCTISTGEFDPYATVDIVKAFSKKILHSNFVIFPNSDHMVHLEYPEQVISVMSALSTADVAARNTIKKLLNN